MRRLKYSDDAFKLRLEFPHEWMAEVISDVKVSLHDLEAAELLAATSCTLGITDSTQLNGAVSPYTDELVVELTGAGVLLTPAPGDRFRIAASAAGPAEDVECLHYNGTTKVVTLTRDLIYGHSDNTRIYSLWCTYSLDISTTTTFTLGRQLAITWEPICATGYDNLPVRERAEIVNTEFAIQGFEERFAALHPREYYALTHPDRRLSLVLEESHRQLRSELLLRGLEINRIVDQEMLVPALMNKVRWLTLLNGDDRYTAERDVTQKEYSRQFDILCKSPIWADDNMDKATDDDSEYGQHPPIFYRSF